MCFVWGFDLGCEGVVAGLLTFWLDGLMMDNGIYLSGLDKVIDE